MNTPNSQVTEQARELLAREVAHTDFHVERDAAIRAIEAALTARTEAPPAAEGGFVVPEHVRRLIGRIDQFRMCMSYNESYFGEPPGLLKGVFAELGTAVNPIYPDGTTALYPGTKPTYRPQPAQGDGWLPIESAPRDGTEVFVYVPGDSLYPTVAQYDTPEYFEKEYGDREYMEEGWRWTSGYPADFHEETISPTHWRPLPPPPAPADGGKK